MNCQDGPFWLWQLDESTVRQRFNGKRGRSCTAEMACGNTLRDLALSRLMQNAASICL